MKKSSIFKYLIPLTFATAVYGASVDPYALYGAWPSNNGGNANLDVVTTDTVLNPNNVAQLTQTWNTFIVGPLHVAVTSTPVIADGNVYYASSGGIIYSYTESGTLNWSTQLMDDNGVPEFFDESPVLTKGKLFIGGRQMHALDRNTGQELWATVYDSNFAPFMPSGMHEPSQLMVAGNNVIYGFGFSNEAFGGAAGIALYPYTHGEIVAFNQDTGNVAWRLDLTKDPVTGAQYGAGSGTFSGGGVDTKRHLFFIGTGNQYVAPSSPISDSLLAINYNTGKIVWSYQYQPNDIWGEAGNNTPFNGMHDFDVQGHPQIFSVTDNQGNNLDLVGARGKDGTYRIFMRDPQDANSQGNKVKPVVQVELGPPASGDGSIKMDPVIKNGVLYITSNYWIDPLNPNVWTSIDILQSTQGQFAPLFQSTLTVEAIDLKKLVSFGLKQLAQGNTVPVCATNFYPSLCSGQLPSNVFLWQKNITPLELTSSSGMTYDNGVLFLAGLSGNIYMIKAATGDIISQSIVFPINPPFLGFLSAGPILGGISIDNGHLFVPVGVDFPGPDANFSFLGGIAAYQLP